MERPEPASVFSIARGAALTFSITVGGALAAYGVQFLLARWMGVSAYGAYVYVWSWASLLAVPAALGFPAALLRFIPQYEAEGNPAELGGILRCSVLTALGCGTMVAIVGGGGVLLWSAGDRVRALSLAIALGAVPFITLTTLLSEGSRAVGRVVLAYAPYQLLRPCVLALVACFIVLETGRLGIYSALAATFAAIIATLTVSGYLFRRALPHQIHRVAPAFDAKLWLQVAWPLGAAATLGAVLDQAPTVIIGLLLRPSDVGIYYVAARSAALISFVIAAVNALAAPAFSAFHWRNQRDELARLVDRLSHLIFWPSLAVALVIGIAARPLLSMFGPAFEAGQPVLLVLAGGQLINAGAGSVGYLLQMTGHEMVNLNVLIAAVLIDVILLLTLVPLMGCVGAAIAGALSMALWNIWLHVLVTRRLGVRPSIIFALLRPMRN
ncbi:MAG TPA: oligosaccharide flippase family protein [Candidatus Binataceae bacterium]|jgi:O-antigen/teichoic acid export membrane protein|nr:oligosaccharide flippase family protein [Candidatus Binataceae bacterium]